MRARRWVVGVFVALYALQSLFPLVYTTSVKFGWARLTDEMQRFAPLTDATSVVQIVVWWVGLVLLFLAAWRLVRGRPALLVFAVASVLEIGNWLSFKLGTVYNRTFDADEQKFDYVLVAILIILGGAIWLIERNDAAAVEA